MAKALFSKPFDFTDHTRGMSIHFDAGDKEVTTTEEILLAAIEAGAATRVGAEPKTAKTVADTAEFTGKADDTDEVSARSASAAAKAAGSAAAPSTTTNPTGKTSSTSGGGSTTVSTTASSATTNSKG